MSVHGFKSVFMVGAIASAALGCYLVNLRVASERAALEGVENKIVLAQRDIRLLNTEIGTRGRLAQLERWNVKVIRLSAPSADQFVESSFQLATLVKPETHPVEAPLVYAAAPAPVRRGPVIANDDGSEAGSRGSRPLGEMMHVAGYPRPELKAETRLAKVPVVASVAIKAKVSAVKTAKPATNDTRQASLSIKKKAKSNGAAPESNIARTTTSTAKESGAH